MSELDASRSLEDDDALGIPRQPRSDARDESGVSRIAGDEHGTFDVVPVRILQVLACAAHAPSVSKGTLTYKRCARIRADGAFFARVRP
ncbi:hypothetical protein GCM10010213_28790 [Microbacterium maritypicum]|uniref:Uncharacterized protein n=1 Tax=Microbacterium maritypicum TaxID=33918 RepID=A0A4Y4B8Z7_MICMQ|nr:hypothetical protein MLI01_16490 [Microbacterium liquefaciens]GGV63795.1 hypothetical protein GCM10010213_28790 [Microbacterium liquefaciens]